jgi:hypothetical protein
MANSRRVADFYGPANGKTAFYDQLLKMCLGPGFQRIIGQNAQ